IYANYDHNTPGDMPAANSRIDATTFDEAMLKLASRWFRGQPKFETLTIKAKKCPKKGEELEKLVYAAWCEALNVPVPTAEDLVKQQEERAKKRDAFRDKLLAELRGGKKGITKWNKRDSQEREKAGSLRDLDFSNEKMAEVELSNTDLRGTKFDGASLRKA